MKHILAALALMFGMNAHAAVEYTIEKGFDTDPRVVEFTPKARPDYVCVYVEGGNDGGLSCFPKRDKKKTVHCKKDYANYICKEK